MFIQKLPVLCFFKLTERHRYCATTSSQHCHIILFRLNDLNVLDSRLEMFSSLIFVHTITTVCIWIWHMQHSLIGWTLWDSFVHETWWISGAAFCILHKQINCCNLMLHFSVEIRNPIIRHHKYKKLEHFEGETRRIVFQWASHQP